MVRGVAKNPTRLKGLSTHTARKQWDVKNYGIGTDSHCDRWNSTSGSEFHQVCSLMGFLDSLSYWIPAAFIFVCSRHLFILSVIIFLPIFSPLAEQNRRLLVLTMLQRIMHSHMLWKNKFHMEVYIYMELQNFTWKYKFHMLWKYKLAQTFKSTTWKYKLCL